MKNLSTVSVNLMTEFLVSEVEAKALDGITYALMLKDGKHDAEINKYDELRRSLDRDGFGANEIFRRYELSNGIIYDLDIKMAVELTIKLSVAVAKANGGKSPVGDLNIAKESEERRREDIKLLAKKALNSAKNSGKVAKMEVALFSRNKVPKIVLTGTNSNGKSVACQYDAFAVRHLDIEEMNREFMVPSGYRVIKIEPCEILPSCTGVRCILYVAKL